MVRAISIKHGHHSKQQVSNPTSHNNSSNQVWDSFIHQKKPQIICYFFCFLSSYRWIYSKGSLPSHTKKRKQRKLPSQGNWLCTSRIVDFTKSTHQVLASLWKPPYAFWQPWFQASKGSPEPQILPTKVVTRQRWRISQPLSRLWPSIITQQAITW
jgi:hypothetical protein